MTRGGKRPGAGGKKPPLPENKRRRNYTIKFSPLEMKRIKQTAREQGHRGYSSFIRVAALQAADWILNKQTIDDFVLDASNPQEWIIRTPKEEEK